MRPTGSLHLGNYHGALKNWTELQYQYDCYFFVADYHALTTGYEDTRQLEDFTWQMVVDWLERFADLAGVKVIATSSAGMLARVIKEFHEHVKASAIPARVKGVAGMGAVSIQIGSSARTLMWTMRARGVRL